MFKKLCENLDKEHINLLQHIEIRWLSKGRVLNRVFELKGELQEYFQKIVGQILPSALKMKNGCRN
jgi:hypothetical protein